MSQFFCFFLHFLLFFGHFVPLNGILSDEEAGGDTSFVTKVQSNSDEKKASSGLIKAKEGKTNKNNTQDSSGIIRLKGDIDLSEDTKEARLASLIESLKQGISGIINIVHTTQFISLLVTKKAKDGSATDAVLRVLMDFKGWADTILNQQTSYLLIKNEDQLLQIATKTLLAGRFFYNYLEAIIESGLTEFKPFDSAVLARILKADKVIPFEKIKKQIADFEKKTFLLQQDAEKANLTWYNIVARKVENAIITPFQKYNITYGIKLGSISLFVGTYIIWSISAEYFKHKYEHAVQEEKNKLPVRKRILASSQKDQILGAGIQLLISGVPPVQAGQNHDFFDTEDEWLKADFNSKRNASAINIAKVLGEKDEADKYWHEQFRKEWLNKNIPLPLQKLFNILGWPISLNSQTGGIDHAELQKNPNEYGWISHINAFAQTLLTRGNPIITYAAPWALNEVIAWYYGDREKSRPGFDLYVNKKIIQIWNFLRGGAYAEQAHPFEFVPTVDFRDVIGMDDIKESFEILIEFLLNPEVFINTKTTPERGYLLTGPTRTGKSFFIEALFGEIVRRSRERGKDIGLRFRKVFAYELRTQGNSIEFILMIAKMYAPSMLWFEELDLLKLQRTGDSSHLQDFLSGMGNSFDNDPKKLVIVIATTNRPEHIDFAIKQPGRFGIQIHFDYPPAKYRRQYIINELLKMAIDPSQFDIELIVQKTAGQSFEGLRMLIKAATIASWIKKVSFTQELLEEVIDSQLRRILVFDHKELPESEKDLIATHMAGQALVHYLLSSGAERLDKVTIRGVMASLKDEHIWSMYYKDNPSESDEKKVVYGALFTKHLYDTVNIKSYSDIINQVKILLAGFVAEEIFFGASTFKFHDNDSTHAFKILESLVFKGVDKEKLSSEQIKRFAEEIFGLRDTVMASIKQLLQDHQKELEAIILALKNKLTLTSNDIEDIIDQLEIDNTQEDSSFEKDSSSLEDNSYESSTEIENSLDTTPQITVEDNSQGRQDIDFSDAIDDQVLPNQNQILPNNLITSY